jgi:acetoin utilization deacetylase AcuC-like enzyme
LLKVFGDQAFARHETGPLHPESPARFKTIMEALEHLPGVEIASSCPEASRSDIELIHNRAYFDLIASLPSNKQVMLDPDTAFSPATFEAALKAAGAVIEAVKYVFRADNNRAFCPVRPPGHHALPDKAMGFCIFNNIAIGAASAINREIAGKIAIVDWDVHHGNGTQHSFYASSDVLYISLHQYPHYPGTGSASEIGEGEGKGFTLNIPMASGSDDDVYREAFRKAIIPAIENYRPDLIMISAGFDSHRDDPLAGIRLSTGMYGEMTRMLLKQAKKYCRGRIVSTLEGGYNLNALADSVKLHLQVLNES